MQCPECQSTHIRKNGIKRGKQNHICVDCRRQFVEGNETSRGYSHEVKRECLKMYVNGMGFCGIERVKHVHHTTVIYWLKQVGENLPLAYAPDPIPEVGNWMNSKRLWELKTQNLDGLQWREATSRPSPPLDGSRPLHVWDFRLGVGRP